MINNLDEINKTLNWRWICYCQDSRALNDRADLHVARVDRSLCASHDDRHDNRSTELLRREVEHFNS